MASPKKKPSAVNDSLKGELLRLQREFEVEAALEKVRNRAMAMRTSAEQAETSAVMFHEIKELGINVIRSGVAIIDEAHEAIELWLTTISEKREVVQILDYVNIHVHPVYENILPARKKKKPYALTVLTGAEVKDYYQRMSTYMTLPKQKTYNGKEHFYSFFFGEGSINVIVIEPLTKAECSILSRFANTFGLIYTRFIDLQKAEKQAQEARIESSLERIRSRSMAMRKSEELGEVAVLLYQELRSMGVTNFFNCGYVVVDVEHTIQHAWTKGPEGKSMQGLKLPLTGDKVLQARYEAWQRQDPVYYHSVGGDELRNHVAFVNPPLGPREVDKMVKTNFSDPTVFYSFNFANGYLHIISNALLNVEDEELTIRFTRVFEMTYRRFLDLQKAEAQAREATIEAALEKVRGKAMAMHNSEDLATTMHSFYNELISLCKTPIIRCGAALLHRDNHIAELTSVSRTKQGELVDVSGKIDVREHPLLINTYDNWLIQKEYRHVLRGNEIKAYYQYMTKQIGLPDYSADAVQYFYIPMFTEGSFYIITETELAQEEVQVYNRFVSVLNLTYKRYNDIRKAEAQAREATIEAALERVRGKALAMHTSSDLATTAGTVLSELKKLGISPLRFAVGLVDKKSRKSQSYSFLSSSDGDTLALVGSITLSGNPVIEKVYASWEAGEDYFPELFGDAWKSYYEAIAPALSMPPVPQAQLEQKHFGSFLYISLGYVVAWTQEALDETEVRTIKRFASIIDLTFRRYIELQIAEASALEATRSASLDRLRAEIASMRSTKDLNRITPLIWSELTTLGVPFVRCGVHIIDEEKKLLYNYLNTPDGKAISTADGESIAFFQLPFDISGFFARVVSHWKEKKIYLEHLDKTGFAEIATTLVKHGVFTTEEQYLSTLTHTDLDGHFLPFLQGMLYVANTSPLDANQLDLLQSLADAFSTAYARYEDFNKLESAKVQIEKTLVDLKLTQTQLVQSEKMASLGELTAGIAHEIQNPLNFVNNFSEVSKELLDEMGEELKKGNNEDALQIAKDIIQNLEKINFHGKRADGIVKSMLQHSRKSTGQKEPTDINALCDEYLRLSYHGLRAKDKSFNAKFETDLDPAVGSLNVLPQEIGRVVLNLINNAFYAVSEKKKLNLDGYEPTVTVSTKKTGTHIEILVRDNGTGIPQKALDKIFNPFFTTKPTGQGTGLGLSLSYDIITKGHGGELKVVTKEGEGSEFTILLTT